METSASAIWQNNRVILCHFDSYSTALVFARWPSGSLLAPEPLPASAQPMEAPQNVANLSGEMITQAAINTLGIGDKELHYTNDYQAWVASDAGPTRVHLLRFTTLDAPPERIEAQGGVFKPLSALRGAAQIELGLLRKVFDLIMSGGGK